MSISIMESLKAEEWSKLGSVKSGAADQINDILAQFEKTLPPEVNTWLYNTRSTRREEATVCFQNAVDIYKQKEV